MHPVKRLVKLADCENSCKAAFKSVRDRWLVKHCQWLKSCDTRLAYYENSVTSSGARSAAEFQERQWEVTRSVRRVSPLATRRFHWPAHMATCKSREEVDARDWTRRITENNRI